MKRKNNLFLLTLQGFSYGVFISYMIGMLFEQFGLISYFQLLQSSQCQRIDNRIGIRQCQHNKKIHGLPA